LFIGKIRILVLITLIVPFNILVFFFVFIPDGWRISMDGKSWRECDPFGLLLTGG
jgi:hypothetical protein